MQQQPSLSAPVTGARGVPAHLPVIPVTPSSSTLSPEPAFEAAAADTTLAGLEPCMHVLLCPGAAPCVAVRPAGLLLDKDKAFMFAL